MEKIKSKCNVGRTVNIQRSFNDAGNGSSCLCKSGASIVVKECVLYDVPLGYVWFQLTHFLSFALDTNYMVNYRKKITAVSKKGPKNKAKVRNGFDMVVLTVTDDKDTVFDCNGSDW